jgi:hypothetical protein
MTLTEIQKLNNAELGKRLAEAIGWTLIESVIVENGYIETSSGSLFRPHLLCVSLDTISHVEQIVIAAFGKYDYGETLIDLAGMSGSHLSGISSNGICEIATMTARQRAEACLLAFEQPLENAAAVVCHSSPA